MSITTVLFDLDGTLLSMDQEVFAKAYMNGLCQAGYAHGYEAKTLAKTIWAGTAAMVKNDGRKLNKDAFWEQFANTYGADALADMPMFDEFYRKEFQDIRHLCGFQPKAAELIGWLKDKGICLVLATNPLFPAVATQSRVRWAGLQPEDFAFITTFDNSCHCKPNPAYYRDILEQIHAVPEECLMVGNDVDEDMIARQLGMQVFLLTDCLINKNSADLAQYPRGDFAALIHFLRETLER